MTTKNFHTVLITGASSGIGQALAEALAAPNVNIAICGRNAGRLNKVAKTCEEKGAIVHAKLIDVKKRNSMEQWIKSIDKDHPLDCVIANAGISAGSQPESPKVTEEIFNTNVFGIINTVLPAISLMRVRGYGQIAMMSSLAAFRGFPGHCAYAASKSAVRTYGEALRVSLAPQGIYVSVICPGFVETRLTANNKFPMPNIMPPVDAAEIIIGGLKKKKLQIAFPRRSYYGVRLLSMLPTIVADTLVKKISASLDCQTNRR